ncbi:rhomboid protease GluP [Geobacter sp. OR-1]|uniref:rhomboid family intramembrane serine protease n=1 Tax=Geobacter sp. OR-1 TaxID=1266765 RepID=UPI000543BEA0|nr:rhomboid family intramembrane serine protease [Geobacter sp. OR-1]GAM09385.1 rhomboid protease GluP [Geobacter sp. OR-1]
MAQRAMLCSRCRKIIGSTEVTCSWCGAARPSSLLASAAWTRGALDGDWLVRAIITVNIGMYIFSLMISSHRGDGLNPLSFMSPGQTALLVLGGTGTLPIEQFGRYWTLVSANYLHGGILHLVFNLMALRQIAPWVSQEYGASRMFVIYTIGGIIGFWLSWFAGVYFTIGASAAVCSLIGALLYFGKSRGGAYGAMVYREVSGWVVGLVLFGLMMPGINNWGHGGGLLGGILLGMLLGYQEQGSENAFHRLLSLLCAVLTVGVLAWAVYGAVLLTLTR